MGTIQPLHARIGIQRKSAGLMLEPNRQQELGHWLNGQLRANALEATTMGMPIPVMSKEDLKCIGKPYSSGAAVFAGVVELPPLRMGVGGSRHTTPVRVCGRLLAR